MPSVPILEPSAKLVSYGAKSSHHFLNGSWRAAAPVNDFPHFVKEPQLHLYNSFNCWCIGSSLAGGMVYAQVQSNAQHPNTVTEVWQLFDGAGWRPDADICFKCEGPNSKESPFLMEELGQDFFLRIPAKRQVWWWHCGHCEETFHSGAKVGVRGVAGKRWCPVCKSCLSANNYKSQHVQHLHLPNSPEAVFVRLLDDRCVMVGWRVSEADLNNQLAISVGYQIQIQVGNADFQTLVSNSFSTILSLSVSDLHHGGQYRFRVAAISIAGQGQFSPPSAPIVIPSEFSLPNQDDLLAPPAPPTPPTTSTIFLLNPNEAYVEDRTPQVWLHCSDDVLLPNEHQLLLKFDGKNTPISQLDQTSHRLFSCMAPTHDEAIHATTPCTLQSSDHNFCCAVPLQLLRHSPHGDLQVVARTQQHFVYKMRTDKMLTSILDSFSVGVEGDSYSSPSNDSPTMEKTRNESNASPQQYPTVDPSYLRQLHDNTISLFDELTKHIHNVAHQHKINILLRQDKNGQNILHHLCKVGRMAEVIFLYTHGADLSCKDKDGQLPMFHARANGHTELCDAIQVIMQRHHLAAFAPEAQVKTISFEGCEKPKKHSPVAKQVTLFPKENQITPTLLSGIVFLLSSICLVNAGQGPRPTAEHPTSVTSGEDTDNGAHNSPIFAKHHHHSTTTMLPTTTPMLLHVEDDTYSSDNWDSFSEMDFIFWCGIALGIIGVAFTLQAFVLILKQSLLNPWSPRRRSKFYSSMLEM